MTILIISTRKVIKYYLFILLGILSGSNILSQNNKLILAVASDDNSIGIIDTTGEWYIPPDNYCMIGAMSKGFAQAAKYDYYLDGFIHLESKLFIPLTDWNKGPGIENYEDLSIYDYTFLYKTVEGNDTMYKSTKYFSEYVTSSISYDTLYKPNYNFVNGIAPVWTGEYDLMNNYGGGKWGYINEQGKWIFEPVYDIGRLPTNGYILLVQGYEETYYNILKDTLITLPYKSNDFFTEGLSCVGVGDYVIIYMSNYAYYRKGKWGYIDTSYKKVIPLKFDMAFPFSDGFALVKKNNRYGYINKKGRFKIRNIYKEGSGFVDGRAFVRIDDLWGIIDTKGKWVVEPQYTRYRKFSEGFAAVEIDNKWGTINTEGEFVFQNGNKAIHYFQNANEKNCIDCLNEKSVLTSREMDFIKVFEE